MVALGLLCTIGFAQDEEDFFIFHMIAYIVELHNGNLTHFMIFGSAFTLMPVKLYMRFSAFGHIFVKNVKSI